MSVNNKRPKVNASDDEDEDENIENMPQKRFFRSRAHCNPLSHNDAFNYPNTPADVNWKEEHFPFSNFEQPIVRHVDIGCGFGGLTVKLASLFPDKPVVGFEIRAKVCEYVRLRIAALRKEYAGKYINASCVRTNCMRYLPNYFVKGQLQKMFFCFPDPHFKAKNHRRRIISDVLLSEYAHFLEENGKLYAATDVPELHEWHVEKCNAHPCFELVASGSRNVVENDKKQKISVDECTSPEHGVEQDPCIEAILEDTEESKKVRRNDGPKFYAVYRRITLEEELKKAPMIDNLF